jgi:phage-related protein
VARSIGEVYVSVEANTRKFLRESEKAGAIAGMRSGLKWYDRFNKALKGKNPADNVFRKMQVGALKSGKTSAGIFTQAWARNLRRLDGKPPLPYPFYNAGERAGLAFSEAMERRLITLRGVPDSWGSRVRVSMAKVGITAGLTFGTLFSRTVKKAAKPNVTGDKAGAARAGARDGFTYASFFNRVARTLLGRTKALMAGLFSQNLAVMLLSWATLLGGPLVTGLSSLTAGVVAFTAAIGVAAAAVALSLAPAIGAVIGLFGAIAIGFTALSDAKGELKAFKDTVTKQWKEMQKAVAEPLFKGLAGPVTKAMSAVTPLMERMAGAANKVAKQFLTMFAELNFTDLGDAFEPLVRLFGTTLTAGVKGFTDLMIAAAPAAKSLAGGMAEVAKNFADWMSKAGNQKVFQDFLTTGLDLFRQIGDVLKPLGSALFDVVQVAVSGPAQALLTLFADLAQQFKDFTSSAEGQQALKTFFDSIALAGQALAPVIKGLAEGIKRMVTPAAAKALIGVGEAIGAILPIVGTLFNAFAESGILDAFTAAIVQIAEVVSKPGGLLEAMGRLAESFGGALAAVLPSLVGLLDGLFQVIIPIADAVGALLVPIMEALAPVIDKVAEVLVKLAPKFGELMDGLVLLITPLLEPLAEVFLAVADNLDLLNPLMDLVVGILRDFAPILIPLVKLFGELLKGVATGITLFGTIAGKIIEVATGFADWLLKSEPVKKAMEVISGAIDGVTSAIQTAVGWIKDLIGWLGDIKMPDVIGNIQSAIGGIKLPWMASGGIARGPMIAGIGEAGPEAVIPLTRPLSQVDPSVRQMAAMLRGQTVVQQTKVTGAPTGPSRTNIVYVQPTQADPEAVAYSVANRLAAQAG